MAVDSAPFQVGEVVDLVRGTTYKGAQVGEAGPPLLGLGSITPGGGFRADGFKTYGGDCPEAIMVEAGGLYVSLKGATKDGEMIGSVARVPREVGPGRLTQDTVGLRFKSGAEHLSDYVYWCLRTPQYRHYCGGRAMGSAVVALSRSDFLAYTLPARTEHRRTVVNALEAVEAKIEANRRVGETLEEMVRALFKSWFVDFDPVRAKAEGRDSGLPPHMADLFPDRLVDSELGEIPEGWTVSALSDEVQVVSGGTPRTSVTEYWQGDIPWFSVVDTPAGSQPWVVETVKSLTAAGYESCAAKLLPVAATILTARGTVGNVALASREMVSNQSCYGLVSLVGAPYFAYFRAQSQVAGLRRSSHGSVFSTITRGTLQSLLVASPPRGLQGAFDTLVRPVLERLLRCAREDQMLVQTRDALLRELIG